MNGGAATLICLAFLLGQSGPDVVPLNQQRVRLPLEVDPLRRREISQFVLYVSTDQGRTWQQSATLPADKSEFLFYAPEDGEYWFRVATLNPQGKQEPENIYTGPPPQKILVDTRRPIIRWQKVERHGEEVVVAWEIQEEHPDLSSLRLQYRTAQTPAGAWEQVAILPALVGEGRLRIAPNQALTLRLVLRDVAGNQSVAETSLPAETGVTPTAFPPAGPGVAGPNSVPAPPGPPSAVLAGPLLGGAAPPAPAPGLPAPRPSFSSPASAVTLPPAATTAAPAAPPRPLPPVRLVNSDVVTLEYELTQVGPSGIGKVEIWLTEDDGQSWQLWADDPQATSGVSGGKYQGQVKLPHEGVFGFRLVVQNKVGLGDAPPKPGDPPELRVEVDLTPPRAQLYCQPDPQRENALLLRWECEDKNLAATPVTLEWAEQRDGPWKVIQANLPASPGWYSWKLPPDLPVWIYLRLRVRDAAGNEAQAVTPQPQLADLTRPVGRLLGVSAAPR
jgi:hypothetical protein